MSDSEEAGARAAKRKHEEDEDDKPKEDKGASKDAAEGSDEDDDDGWIGPLPSEAAPAKKIKVLPHEKLYLRNLPSAESYERSYMHRDNVVSCVATPSEFIITASCDGHVKFWKKQPIGIEFVKHFRAHLGNIQVAGFFCHLCYEALRTV